MAQDRAAQGRAEVSTTSASIRWIRLSYTYPDESSRVIVYWLKSLNMLGCYMGMRWWNIIDGVMNMLIGSSLPFSSWLPGMSCSIFAMIINLLMGADARDHRGHQGGGDSTA